ncbi:MAG: hypothetical protein AVDCRST_MAG56-6316, partial [uncultured Cytophagales bacterium]
VFPLPPLRPPRAGQLPLQRSSHPGCFGCLRYKFAKLCGLATQVRAAGCFRAAQRPAPQAAPAGRSRSGLLRRPRTARQRVVRRDQAGLQDADEEIPPRPVPQRAAEKAVRRSRHPEAQRSLRVLREKAREV